MSNENHSNPGQTQQQLKKESFNWFPGHMKRTTKLIEKNLKGSNVIIEVIDARIPLSSRSNLVYKLTKNQPRIIILNKSDLANPNITRKWANHFRLENQSCLSICSKEVNSGNARQAQKELINQINHLLIKIRPRDAKPLREFKALIIGVPNVGKSSYINFLCGKKKTRVENRPGVTRGEQIIQVCPQLQLIDLPGLLDHKLSSERGFKLALLGFIKDELIDFCDIGLWLGNWLLDHPEISFLADLPKKYLRYLKTFQLVKYDLDRTDNSDGIKPDPAVFFLEKVAERSGWFVDGDPDLERAGFNMAKEIRAGKWGTISWEESSPNPS